MGQEKSKALKENGDVEITTMEYGKIVLQLGGKYDYPKIPKDKEVDIKYQSITENIKLTEEQKIEFQLMPIKFKWKLICKLEDYLQRNPKRLSEKILESDIILARISENPSLIQLSRLRVFLMNSPPIELENFFVKNGHEILLNLLEIAEVCSRTTKNYAKNLEILRIFQILINVPMKIPIILQLPNVLNIIFFNFNFIHVEITTIVLEILGELLWNSNEAIHLILSSLTTFKLENDFKHRFEPFFKILEESKNILMLENIIVFINTLINSNCEEVDRKLIKSELLGYGIHHIFEVIIILIRIKL